MRRLGWLRAASWLSAERARGYGWILFLLMAVALGYDDVSTALGHHPGGVLTGPPGKPQATDFLSFWVAGRLAWAGHAASAYTLAAMSPREHAAAVLDPAAVLAFFYPPSFLLLCLPFAALPYLGGLAAFVLAQGVALVAGLRRILLPGLGRAGARLLWGALPVLAFPGLLMNAATGQNGFWSAACFAWGLIWLEARPGLAGACLGMLVIKPHLALAVPVALLAARRWRALLACCAAGMGWMAAAWAVLGSAAWRGFFAAAPAIRDALENHPEDWGKLQSLFTSLRLWGAPLGVAYVAQLGLAVAVLAVLARLAWRRPGGGAEMAAAAAACVLCTPHVLDYDLAVTGVPLAWIAGRAVRTGWLPWEKAAAGLAFLWPLVARLATQSGAAPVAPVILAALFAVTCRRGWRADAAAAPVAPAWAMAGPGMQRGRTGV